MSMVVAAYFDRPRYLYLVMFKQPAMPEPRAPLFRPTEAEGPARHGMDLIAKVIFQPHGERREKCPTVKNWGPSFSIRQLLGRAVLA